ncbi:MAG: winged helix-turn-helix domain-containing protein [Candidatus Pacebacteria bacterium]|nr:winged helix-turn-helix domain-containing protein [Candidatus Paceibacterota bacterium]
MINEERISKLTSATYKVTDLFADKEPLKFAIRRACLDVLSSYVSCIENTSLELKKQFAQKGEIQSKVLIRYFVLAEHQDWIDPKNFEILEIEYSSVNQWFSEQFSKLKKSLENKRMSYKDKQEYREAAHPKELVSSSLEAIAIENKVNYSEQLVSSAPTVKVVQQVDVPTAPEQHLSVAKEENRFIPLNADISSELVNSGKPEIKDKNDLYNIEATINYEELSATQLRILEILQSSKFLKSGDICDYFENMSDRNIRREIKELRDKGIVITKGNGRSTYYQLNYIY